MNRALSEQHSQGAESPILIDTGAEIRRAIDCRPLIASGTLWQGLSVETFTIPAGGWPPRGSLVSHLIGVVKECPDTTQLAWREGGIQKLQRLRPGDVVLRSQQELVDFHWNQPIAIQFLGISHETMASILQDFCPKSNELRPLFNARDDHIAALMQRLVQALGRPSPSSALYGESLCHALAWHGMRRYGTEAPNANDSHKHTLSAKVLCDLVDYIYANLALPLTRVELAKIAGLSVYYFDKIFSRTMGQPVHRFVLEARLNAAKRMVGETTIPILQIATRTGFSDQSHLAHAFRQRFGYSLSQIRRERKGRIADKY